MIGNARLKRERGGEERARLAGAAAAELDDFDGFADCAPSISGAKRSRISASVRVRSYSGNAQIASKSAEPNSS